MAVDTDFAADAASDSRDLRFFAAEPSRARSLSAAQVERFNRAGFLSGIPAFAKDQIDPIRTYFDDLIEVVLSADDRRNAYSINTYHLVCAGLYDLLRTPILLDYVADVLGPSFGCGEATCSASSPETRWWYPCIRTRPTGL